MEIYLVGGAVRDELLGYPVHERDWVVVGATPDDMIAAGYRQVGRDFPVFIHPQTQEEYALARTERKSGHGYHGFTCYSAPGVTLEQDLERRDLTINAMARASDGTLVDPYGGRADLDARLLRHVSAAFQEDPLRILRTARFAARYHHLGFRVADETRELMQAMVRAGEVDYLVPERTWKETERALAERNPSVFFQTLHDCGALARLLPELAHELPAPLAPLDAAARAGLDSAQRFAALTADFGATAIRSLCERVKAPNDFRELALLSAKALRELPKASDAETVAALLQTSDALRRPERFLAMLEVAMLFALTPAQRDRLAASLHAAAAVRAADIGEHGLQGPALGAALQQARIDAIGRVLEQRT